VPRISSRGGLVVNCLLALTWLTCLVGLRRSLASISTVQGRAGCQHVPRLELASAAERRLIQTGRMRAGRPVWIIATTFIRPGVFPLFALEQALARLADLDKDITALADTEPYRRPVGWLRCFRGIDTLSAMILLAEIVDFQRFRHPRELMAYLGLVPSEYSSGEVQRRGAITKAGNTHARRVLVEAAWHYRHRPTVGDALRRRTTNQPLTIVGQAWRAQQRLHRRYRHLIGHGKRPPVAVVAVARELVGFLWAAMTQPTVAVAA
jgi:Transposase IS116/IS110/IS902 family